jgi:hypothetical protein
MPMEDPELSTLSNEVLVALIFDYARSLGEIAEELDRRAAGDQRTLELAAALEAISRLLRASTPPKALLEALSPLLDEHLRKPDPVN